MKQITLNIREAKFPFFLELIKSLDFVQIEGEGDSEEAIVENIKRGLEEVKLANHDGLNTTPARDFIDAI